MPENSMKAGYERISAQDRSFFVFEDANAHMHLGGLALFEAASLALPDGGLDIDRLRAHIASRLHLVPRYRQRLTWVPIMHRPVWIDDTHFNLAYHVRHTAVPHPGDDRQLKALAGWIMSQQLDRSKPLWELWVIEGLRDDRIALLVKTHHAVADGISAFELFTALLSPFPDDTVEAPQPWLPRPAPPAWALLRDELVHEATTPLALALDLLRGLRSPTEFGVKVGENLRAVWELVGAGLPLPPSTPLNRPIGSGRRFDWLTHDLDDVKAVKNQLGGTVNDVVLATVAGAVRHFLQTRHVDVGGLEFRLVVPVSLRSETERGVPNNRVSAWLMSIPIDEPDPRRRLALVAAETERRKQSKQALGAAVLGQFADYLVPGVLTLGVRLAARLHPYNLIVTNLPGPQEPLYLLNARLLAGYPQVPLFENQSLGIALISYCGKVCWGFNADWDELPDVQRFAHSVAIAFDELCDAAGVEATHEPAVAYTQTVRARSRATTGR